MKIDFEFQTEHGRFVDALHLPDDHTFTEQELDAMKAQRRDNWIAAITNPEPDDRFVEVRGVRYEKIQIDGNVVLKPVEM